MKIQNLLNSVLKTEKDSEPTTRCELYSDLWVLKTRLTAAASLFSSGSNDQFYLYLDSVFCFGLREESCRGKLFFFFIFWFQPLRL